VLTLTSKSEVGKTSYGAVQENLCSLAFCWPASKNTVSILATRGAEIAGVDNDGVDFTELS